ncbi:MAG: YdjY domain-containing protein [candidate division KSB1 bacterium]|nr:YdjY domain-containing protein [candidate division KSB1 bacterium]
MQFRYSINHLFFLIAFCLAGFITSTYGQDFFGLDKKHPLAVDRTTAEVRILAEFNPGAFSGRFKWTPRYHFVVWKKGRAASEALFKAYVSDRDFYAALERIGARPGNNLTTAAWDERNNPGHPAPDTRIEGTPVDIRVWWKGLSKPIPVDSLLVDPGGQGFDFRFGGNLALIPEWKSGCIVCLYSCPGSKVGNRAYTIRDYARGTTRFEVRPQFRRGKKRKAVIFFRLRPEDSENQP